MKQTAFVFIVELLSIFNGSSISVYLKHEQKASSISYFNVSIFQESLLYKKPPRTDCNIYKLFLFYNTLGFIS